MDLSQFERAPLVFTGMGASLFAVMPAMRVLRAAGRRPLRVPATELLEPGGERLGGAFIGPFPVGRERRDDRRLPAHIRAATGVDQQRRRSLADVADRALPIGSVMRQAIEA